MITVEAVTEDVLIHCPHCHDMLAKWVHKGFKMFVEGYLYNDSDTIPFDQPPDLNSDIALYAFAQFGNCALCDEVYIGVSASMVVGVPDRDFVDRYFMSNQEADDVAHNYNATRGKKAWQLTTWQTPLGPMLQHEFGPIAWTDKMWIGPSGVAGCSPNNKAPQWVYAERLVLALWDDLSKLQRDWHAKKIGGVWYPMQTLPSTTN